MSLWGGDFGRPAVARRRGAINPQPPAGADFSLSATSVVTSWGIVAVGTLTPINAPAGVKFRVKASATAKGAEARMAVRNNG